MRSQGVAKVKLLFEQAVQCVPSNVVGHGSAVLGLDPVEDEFVDAFGFERNLKVDTQSVFRHGNVRWSFLLVVRFA